MAADGAFSGGQSPDRTAATEAGREFIDRLADLAASDPGAALDVVSHFVDQAGKIKEYAQIRAARGAADMGRAEQATETPSGPTESELDELGRNQRSRVREVMLLEIIERNAAPCALSKLMSGLAARRISDSQAAVVSHLHRLKANGLITQPGNGFYDITSDGLGHLRKLRASLGSLVP